MNKFEVVYLEPEDTFQMRCRVTVTCGQKREGSQPEFQIDWQSARDVATFMDVFADAPESETSRPVGWKEIEPGKIVLIYTTQFANMYYYYKEVTE